MADASPPPTELDRGPAALAARGATSDVIDIVRGRTAIDQFVLEVSRQCHEEVLVTVPGRGPHPLHARSREARGLLSRAGVAVRALYEVGMLRDKNGVTHLDLVASQGTTVRLSATLPLSGIVIDRRLALLPLSVNDSRDGSLVVIRAPLLIDWMAGSFEQLWARSVPLEEARSPASNSHRVTMDPVRARILRLMADGEKDEVIARRLSISVRTCRRYIAEYLEQVGAESRFQAGVIAARSGHLDLL